MYLTRRSKIILLAAPAVLMVCVLLGQLALQSMGVAALELADVNLKALGNFSLDPGAGRTKDIPRRWRDLDGQRVSVRGFMLNPRQLGTGSVSYQLVYDMPGSFGRPPLIQDRVYATAPPRTLVLSASELGRFNGVLHVGVQRDSTGQMSSVFRMDVESVTDLDDSANPPPPPPPGAQSKWDFLVYAYLLVIAFVLFTEWHHRRLVHRRAVAGLCPICGYDLRASTGRCPECGAKVRTGSLVSMTTRV